MTIGAANGARGMIAAVFLLIIIKFAFGADLDAQELRSEPQPSGFVLPEIDLKIAVGIMAPSILFIYLTIIYLFLSPRVFSTITLLLASVAYLFLMQSEGGLLDSCYGYSFFDVDTIKCRGIGAAIGLSGDKIGAGDAFRGWLALAISKARAENCFALGMGIGGVYSLLFLSKGTKEVAVVHLMHFVWAGSVCAANAQNAGLLQGPFGIAAEANIDKTSQDKLFPFVIITGVQCLLGVTAFVMSLGREKKVVAVKEEVKDASNGAPAAPAPVPASTPTSSPMKRSKSPKKRRRDREQYMCSDIIMQTMYSACI